MPISVKVYTGPVGGGSIAINELDWMKQRAQQWRFSFVSSFSSIPIVVIGFFPVMVLRNVLLGSHTTFGIGCPAGSFAGVGSSVDRDANVLVDDGGFDGLVVRTADRRGARNRTRCLEST